MKTTTEEALVKLREDLNNLVYECRFCEKDPCPEWCDEFCKCEADAFMDKVRAIIKGEAEDE